MSSRTDLEALLAELLDPEPGRCATIPALLRATEGAPSAPRLDHVRYKPGASVVARIAGEPGDQPWWFAAYAPALADKAEKNTQRAAESGYPLASGGSVVHSRLRLQAGPIGLDRNLFKELGRAGVVDAGGAADGAVLSYNPWRRLVLRRAGRFSGWSEGRTVVRLWAAPPESASLIGALHDAGAAVLPARPFGSGGIVQPWVSGGDLDDLLTAAGPGEEHEAALARAAPVVAGLHAVGTDAAGARRVRLPRVDPVCALAAASDGVRAGMPGLIPAFGAAADEVRAALAADTSPEVLVHGDLSADQIVFDGAGEPWLIDLDRMGVAPAGCDLGGFIAVEILRGRGGAALDGFVEAYRASRPDAPLPASAVSAWTALHILLRVSEPFRGLDPAAMERGRARIDLARACLAGRPASRSR